MARNEQGRFFALPGDGDPASPYPLWICGRTLAYQPGQASAVLTKHYLRMHPEAMNAAAEATEP